MTPTATILQTAIRIKNLQTGRLLYDNTNHGLISWQESMNADGFWYITPVADKIYKIKNQHTGNCIYHNTSLKKLISWQDSASKDGKWAFSSSKIFIRPQCSRLTTPRRVSLTTKTTT